MKCACNKFSNIKENIKNEVVSSAPCYSHCCVTTTRITHKRQTTSYSHLLDTCPDS